MVAARVLAVVLIGLRAVAPAAAADCDPVRSVVRAKASAMVVGYPGPGQDHFVLEAHVALANNVRTDLQGPTPPIDESDRPHYCDVLDGWARKLFVATDGRYRLGRAHFWEIDADENRGEWKIFESPFPVHWQLGHAFADAFWPKVYVDRGSPIIFSDFPVMCTGSRFVNADGTFTSPNSRCDADRFDIAGTFTCETQPGAAFCFDGDAPLAGSPPYLASILHHEGGHFLFGLPDETDKTFGKIGCLGELEQHGNDACGGIGRIGEWSYGDEPLDPLGSATSVMGVGFRDHFCDPTTHTHAVLHDFTDAGGGEAISRNEDHDGSLNASMWEILRETAPGLDNDVHTDGVYDAVDANDLPAVDCVFHGATLRNDPLLVLDRSFSMNVALPADPDYTALDAAKEAAANLYNLVPDGIFAGVTAYNAGFSVAVPYAPVDFGAPGQGKISVEEHLPFGPNGNTDIIQAIDESRQIVVEAQQASPGQLSGSMILLSDGVPNEPADLTPAEQRTQILLAAIRACTSGDPPIAIHTIAFGDADPELLHEIAGACDGLMRVNGGNRSAEETPLDYKESLARMGYAARGRSEVLHERQLVTAATQSFALFVPEATADLELTWLGKPHAFVPGSAPGAPPLATCGFDELDFDIVTPGGAVVPAAGASPVGPLELGYGARTARQAAPEAGWWTARVHAPPNCVATMPEVVWLGTVRNGWYAATLDLGDPVAPRNVPVTVEARMYYAGARLTGVFVLLQARRAGQGELLLASDDGVPPDVRAADGVYTATIPPLGGGVPPGGVTVRALWVSVAGVSAAVGDSRDVLAEGVLPGADGLPVPGTALLLGEETLVRRACCRLPADSTVGCSSTCRAGANLDQPPPVLVRGTVQRDVRVQLCGLRLLPGRVQAGMGAGVAIENLRTSWDPATDCGTLAFEARVRADAEPGTRLLRIESGGALLRAEGGAIVCAADGRPALDVRDVAVQACVRRARVALPPPLARAACGEHRDVALSAVLRTLGGRPLRRPRRVDPDDPVLTLPAGTSEVVWQAADRRTGAVAEAVQRVTVSAAESAACCDLDGDGSIDSRDVDRLAAAIGTSVAPGAPGDVDADGTITSRDVRTCRGRCTRRRCAPPP